MYGISSPGRSRDGKSRAKSEERPKREDGDGNGKGVRGVGGRKYAIEGWEWR